MTFDGFGLEGLLEQHGVLGVEAQRAAIEGGGTVVVIGALGQIGSEVAADEGVGVSFGGEIGGGLYGAEAGGEHPEGSCRYLQQLAKAGPHSNSSFLGAWG
jgi:hypothetical protein